jgi:hypothetical protein
MLAWSVLISSVLCLVGMVLWLTMPRKKKPPPPRVRFWDKDYNEIIYVDYIEKVTFTDENR